MKCKVCGAEMDIGLAIDPREEENALYIANPGNINSEDLEITEVWKCPKCGHSEKME